MEFQHIADFGPIGTDPRATHAFWATTLGIPFEEVGPDHFHAQGLDGAKVFALWSLDQAAEGTFGTNEWPADRPVPQAWIEFEVSSPQAVGETAARLREAGQEILLDAHLEPWGQTTARLLSPKGLPVGISYLPDSHSQTAATD